MKKYTVVTILASALVSTVSFCAMREAATPAHVINAIKVGGYEVVQSCLDDGMDVDQVDTYGRSLLWYACHGQPAIAGLLLERGAKMNISDNDLGSFPIHRAAVGGHTDMVRLLLDSRAEVNQHSWRNSSTPLHNAAMEGNSATVKLLLGRKAGVNQRDCCLEGPLFNAVKSADFAVSQCNAFSGGGDALDKDLATLEADRTDIVRLLILAKADADQVNDISETPFRIASPAIQEVMRVALVQQRTQEEKEK